MITIVSANFAQVSATQTEFWYKLNHQIERKTNKGKFEAKWHNIQTKNMYKRNNANISCQVLHQS